jgi:hypothetical protein
MSGFIEDTRGMGRTHPSVPGAPAAALLNWDGPRRHAWEDEETATQPQRWGDGVLGGWGGIGLGIAAFALLLMLFATGGNDGAYVQGSPLTQQVAPFAPAGGAMAYAIAARQSAAEFRAARRHADRLRAVRRHASWVRHARMVSGDRARARRATRARRLRRMRH